MKYENPIIIKTSTISFEEHWMNDKQQFHREDGPALIRFINGIKISEHYYINNSYSRTDGPAIIYYYQSGKIKSQHYWIKDKICRLDGPAEIYYNELGVIISQYYLLNNKQFNSLKELITYNKTLILN